MALAAIETEWFIMDEAGYRTRVRGFQIGRFGITHVDEGVWRVDHIPSGYGVIELEVDFRTALSLADDLSLYARIDPRYRDPGRLINSLGPQLSDWLYEMIDQDGYTTDFRSWLNQ